MFAYIKGILEEKTATYVIIDVMGVGYKIFMSPKDMDKLGEIGGTVKVYTYHYVRDDNISLYGFSNNEELKMFELLLSVSGIGAKSALGILAFIEPSAFALAVITNDTSKLTKIPGIGNKSAARIILELKDKLKEREKLNTIDKNVEKFTEETDNKNEAIEALQVLGYMKRDIEKALEKIKIENLTTEEIIKKGLNLLGR